MVLDHLQALAGYIKGENVSHISGFCFPFSFFQYRSKMTSEALQRDCLVCGDTFCPTGLYFTNLVLRPI